jgi:uncharacterized glyoxalase superfamily protein PhnB
MMHMFVHFVVSALGIVMLHNRSLPPGSIFPELVYADLSAAVAWLCNVFGFSERVRIGDHRSQLVFGDASIIAIGGAGATSEAQPSHSVMLRVDNVDPHYDRAVRGGARIVRTPETYPFGERQYTAEDLGGHRWTFTQSVADIAPEEWGGQVMSRIDHQLAAKKSRMDHLALPVAAYARSRDWYSRHLGLKVEFEIPERQTVALKDDAGLTIFLYERPDASGTPTCTLTFQVQDVDAKYRELSASGIVFAKSPQKLFWGYGAELRDPDGYMIYLWDEKSMREKGN